MAHLERVWPPDPIRTVRLVLRQSEARDRAAMLDLFSSPEVGTFQGGARPRDEVESAMPEIPGRRPGFFVVELDGRAVGIVTLDQRDLSSADCVHPETGRVELGYLLLPHVWARGYATEACRAVLKWFWRANPNEPLVLSAQVANVAPVRVAKKLGFIEFDRYEAYGATQWFGVLEPAEPKPAELQPT